MSQPSNIKTLVVVIIGLLLFLAPLTLHNLKLNFTVTFSIAAITSCVFVAVNFRLIKRKYNGRILAPLWNDAINNPNKPLAKVQFAGFLFLAAGIGLTINGLVGLQVFSPIGFMAIGFGIGMLAGIKVILKLDESLKQE